MKDYKRLTDDWFGCRACVDGECTIPETFCQYRILCEKHNELVKIENKLESGELCNREELRRETAKEILSEIESYVKTVFKSDMPCTATLPDCLMSAKISALRKEYGVDLGDEE